MKKDSPKRYRKRLLNVARALRESKNPETFTMVEMSNHSCGTPACALGHYASRRDLQHTFVLLRRVRGVIGCIKGDIPASYNDPRVQSHFNINWYEGERLFSASGCGNARTPEQAAEYIEKFVADKTAAGAYGDVK